MDIGDIIRLIFLAFIFLSLFGGLLGRSRESEEEQRRLPRPTDVFESGGQGRPQQQAQRPPQERQMPTTASEWWEELTGGQRSQPEPRPQPRPQPQPRQPEQQVATYDHAIERGEVDRVERQQRRRERETANGRQSAVRASERELLEQDITHMPSPMDRQPRRQRRDREIGADTPRRRRRTGGDVLRRSFSQPETLERAFILKEVLDDPLALREKR